MKEKQKTFEKKEELIKAAIDEFAVKNYEDASLNTIIKSAGISKGTFYYHFQDKQALYLFLLKTSSDAKIEFLTQQMSEHAVDLSRMDMFERFKHQARIGVEFFAAYPEYYKLGIMFLKEKGNKVYDIAKDYLGSTSEAIIEKMIMMAADNGDFRDDLPLDFIVKTLNHLFTNFDQIFLSEEDLEIGRIVQYLDHFVDFMKYGLGRR